MSKHKISKEVGKKIGEENKKIEALIKELNDKGLGIQMTPIIDTNIKLIALVSCLIDKNLIKGEDYSLSLAKMRKEHLEEKVAQSKAQSDKKIIVPNEHGGLILPR